MQSLGCILISDLVVANLFMHSLPGMILLYLTTPFYTKVFLREILLLSYDSCIAIGPEVDQKLHQSVHFLALTIKLALKF